MDHAYQVQKLNKDRASLLIILFFIVMSEPSLELMTKREPIFLNQLLEPSNCSVSTF
jgi:hypothetical protein